MQIKKNFRSMWSTRKTPVVKRVWLIIVSFYAVLTVTAQTPVTVGGGSFASFVPLAESASSSHGGCQAYQMEHRPIYAVDSLLTRPLPSNDWWTYGLINPWTGNLWAYPAVTWATNQGVSVAKLTHWEPTGSEMKWDEPLLVSTVNADGAPITFSEKRLSDWSDFMIRFVMEQDGAQVEVTVMRGSPLVWLEFTGCQPAAITNPNTSDFAIYQQTVGDKTVVAVAVLANGQTAASYAPYAFRIPRHTRYSYAYTAATAKMSTTFHVDYEDLVSTSAQGVAMGFLPHHYKNTTFNGQMVNDPMVNYMTPRGQMRLAYGNDFTFTYDVHPMLPFFPLPDENLEGYSADRMQQLCQQYAAAGTFGADTYWGGKGLTQMMHYMTTSLQMGDTATYRIAKKRLKEYLINWYTYTPGETQFYFAYYNRWRALVGFDVSYDSDTFNDHHFHYGYFIYASAVLCMLDPEFKAQYGAMAREVARDYANWTRDDYSNPTGGVLREPWFRMFSPYDGHSFAGGMGNGGNGNGQESTSESMQSWVGIWMLGMALGDPEMLQAGVMGYTVEARATAEYWFDRDRTNIDYTKYTHPWCCNLTMAGVGWWTWFSGDPVWMHSIQWLPISPGLQNYLSEDREFARWDYTEMYAHKEVGNYEAATGGLGNESGLGNVCLSYLALFDPDSAAHVWDRMDQQGKPLAKNADTGGITYLLAHGLRQYGHHNHAISADYPLAVAYTTDGGVTTYAVYNVDGTPRTIHFTDGRTVTAPANALSFFNASGVLLKSTEPIADDTTPRPQDPIAQNWHHAYPNVALHKTVMVSSYENAGCLAVNLTDGDLTTRWGSQHRDNEWARIDLGAQYYIDHITLRWEPAYASRFELSISPDGTNWHSVIYTGSGGVDTRDFAGDLLMQGDSARGRYIRIVGLERATTYGTSLYELEAYGLPLAGNPSQVISMEILSNDISLVPGQTPQYAVHGYNYLGAELTINPTLTHTSPEGRTGGVYTLTAEYGGIKTSYTWPVLEQVTTVAARVTPRTAILSPGDTQVFTIETIDQFGYPTATAQHTYTASQLGLDTVLYTLDGLTDTAFVNVIAFTERNLALGKIATCSGSENDGTLPFNVNDGRLDTRWGSRFRDNEWIQVDLGSNCLLNRIRIFWEASYATSYEVLLSTDMLTWTTVYETTAGKGGTNDILIPTTSARFVRVLCRARNSAYGASIYELEAYGLPEADTELPVMTAATFVSATYQDAILAVSATDNDRVFAYPVYNGSLLLGSFTAVNGQITVTGLTPSTNYSLRVFAKDCSGNVSAQPITVSFRTADLATDRPQVSAPTPDVEGCDYRSVYSDALTSSLAHGFQFNPWGGAAASYDAVYGTTDQYMLFETAASQSVTIGVNNDGENAIIAKPGMSDPNVAANKGLYAVGMTYLHVDVWSQVACPSMKVLINDHVLTAGAVNGNGWQSFDIPLANPSQALLTNLANIRWMKFNDMPANTKVAVDNVYFWRPNGTAAVTSVTLDPSNLSLEVGLQATLTASVHPKAAPQTLTWETSNAIVATVEDGVVTALAEGEAEITARSVSDPTKFAVCTVSVLPFTPKHWYASGSNSGVNFDYYLVYNENRTVSVFTTITTEHTGLATPSWSIDGEWKDLSRSGEWWSRTSEKTFNRGQTVNCFFYQPYAGGAARLDFTYTIGSENQPLPTGIGQTESAPAVRKVLRNGQIYILRDGQIYTVLGL